MRCSGLLGLALGLSIVAAAGAAEPGSTAIKSHVDLPSGPGPFPVAIYANGQGGDVQQALPRAVVEALVQRGFAVISFDWRYRTADPAKGVQSSTLSDEIADLEQALALASRDQRFRHDETVVVAKSMGTAVTARVLAQAPDVRGAVFLTPLCSLKVQPQSPAWFSDPYPGLEKDARPLALIGGDVDPVCHTAALYRLAAQRIGPTRIVVVDGDHGFQVPGRPPGTDNYRLVAENAAAAAEAILRTAR